MKSNQFLSRVNHLAAGWVQWYQNKTPRRIKNHWYRVFSVLCFTDLNSADYPSEISFEPKTMLFSQIKGKPSLLMKSARDWIHEQNWKFDSSLIFFFILNTHNDKLLVTQPFRIFPLKATWGFAVSQCCFAVMWYVI